MQELGLTPNHTSAAHTAYAVYLAVRQPERLQLVTKRLYPDVAKHYATTWKCVERNIRTAVSTVWAADRRLLEAIASHRLPKKPKASEFLSILALYFVLRSEYGCPSAAQKREI